MDHDNPISRLFEEVYGKSRKPGVTLAHFEETSRETHI